MVAMFSEYCAEPFTVEPVKIVSPHNGQTRITPTLSSRTMEVEVDYLNQCCGLSESAESLCELLAKMAYDAAPSPKNKGVLTIAVPPTRPDVLHACDVVSASLLNSPHELDAARAPSLTASTDGRRRRGIWIQQPAAYFAQQVRHHRCATPGPEAQ